MDTTDRRDDQELAAISEDDEIAAMVRDWPPLTESQRERLALLLLV
ncbi:hypothetical protein [Nonomuraea sp. NPDC005692]